MADVRVQAGRHGDTGTGVTLGAAVDLDPRVTVGARLWSGTVIGFGTVDPQHFPCPSSVEPYAVVIVAGANGCVDVWATRYAIPTERDGRDG